MSNSRYYTYRIKLEKLKQKTWTLKILARILFMLVTLVLHYLR
jgi:hypothetical protein